MAACVIPGCCNDVAATGDTCTECLTAFGSWLKPSDVRLSETEIRDRDAYVARAYYAQRRLL